MEGVPALDLPGRPAVELTICSAVLESDVSVAGTLGRSLTIKVPQIIFIHLVE
jgi:hypothetical protein